MSTEATEVHPHTDQMSAPGPDKTYIAEKLRGGAVMYGPSVALDLFHGVEPENPVWLNWWPTPIGRSWLLGSLGLEGTAVSWLVGALWVVGGIAFLGAGFGILTHHEWWRALAVVGAFASLVVLVPYFHPLYALVTVLNISILVALLCLRWPSANLLGA